MSYAHTHTQTQLIDIVKRFETLQNVLLSVTKNIQSILLTAVLAIILIYLYSILGYMFFSNDFMIATNPMEHFTELRKMGECDAGKGLEHKHSVNCIKMIYCGGGGGRTRKIPLRIAIIIIDMAKSLLCNYTFNF